MPDEPGIGRPRLYHAPNGYAMLNPAEETFSDSVLLEDNAMIRQVRPSCIDPLPHLQSAHDP